MTLTPNLRLQKPGTADRYWDVPLNQNLDLLDGLAAIGGLACVPTETPSASLNVAISPGTYLGSTGAVVTFAGAPLAVSGWAVTRVWLDDAGAVGSGPAWPATAALRIATVVSSTVVVAVQDARLSFRSPAVPSGPIPNLVSGSDPSGTINAILTLLRHQGLLVGS